MESFDRFLKNSITFNGKKTLTLPLSLSLYFSMTKKWIEEYYFVEWEWIRKYKVALLLYVQASVKEKNKK